MGCTTCGGRRIIPVPKDQGYGLRLCPDCDKCTDCPDYQHCLDVMNYQSTIECSREEG